MLTASHFEKKKMLVINQYQQTPMKLKIRLPKELSLHKATCRNERITKFPIQTYHSFRWQPQSKNPKISKSLLQALKLYLRTISSTSSTPHTHWTPTPRPVSVIDDNTTQVNDEKHKKEPPKSQTWKKISKINLHRNNQKSKLIAYAEIESRSEVITIKLNSENKQTETHEHTN